MRVERRGAIMNGGGAMSGAKMMANKKERGMIKV